MTALEHYQHLVKACGYTVDRAQLAALQELDQLEKALLEAPEPRGFFRGLFSHDNHPASGGAYLWGGVGRGKTFIMDTFYDALAIEEKLRLHFHRFMILAHGRLNVLGKGKDSLKRLANEYSEEYRVICLDEMHITDNGDAAIMKGLLLHLFAQNVLLVMTSNRKPLDLVRDVAMAKLFEPAARLLNDELKVIHIDGGEDYRSGHLQKRGIWHDSSHEAGRQAMGKAFDECSRADPGQKKIIIINDRDIPVIKRADGIVWFDFSAICGPPRARIDYIEIARYFNTILIQDIPVMDDIHNDKARRFTLLIDEMYDRGVKLIASSCSMPDGLYVGTGLAFEFQRVTSRLLEMQTEKYLLREHQP